MNLAKQKLILEYLLASKDLYARCSGIIKSQYFDMELRGAVQYAQDYYQKYAALPKLDRIKAEFDLDLESKIIGLDDISAISDDCEKFAKKSSIKNAINEAMKDWNDDNFDAISQKIMDASLISLDRDVGIDLYVNTEENLRKAAEAIELISTGIKVLDEKLGGGCARQELTLFSANSGVGKSVLMSNLGDNYAAAGYHVCYISLELSQHKILSRLASIATAQDTKTWKENIIKISSRIAEIAENGGSYVIKRMPMGSTANDMRAYLKQYELVYNRQPDVIIVDYQDVMEPIGGIGNLSISEQDKAKSQQLYEIGVDYNAIMFTASQQNRDGIKNASPDQAVIAGGFSKINVVDNYISIYMTPQMRIEGVMLLYFLKTRSSSGVGENVPVKFDKNTLQITDIGDEQKVRAIISRLISRDEHKHHNKKKEDHSIESVGYSVINQDIEGLPSDTEHFMANSPTENIDDIEESPDGLLGLMSFIQTNRN
jgi:hypothetical protein